MANLATAPTRAGSVSGEKAAARMYNDIEYELAMGEHSPDDEQAGEDALGILQGRFPGIQDAARDVETPPNLSRKAKRNLHHPHEGRSRRGSSRRGASTPRQPARKAAPARVAGPGRSQRAADKVVQVAGAGASAAADTGWGSLVLEMVLGGILLSLGLLLLSHPKGPTELATGSTNLIAAVIGANVDPLNPKGP